MLARLRKIRENDEGGFTLIELLVVMIIIGILAAIAIPAFLSQKQKAYRSAAQSDDRSIAIEVATFLSDQKVGNSAQNWTLANGTTSTAVTFSDTAATPAAVSTAYTNVGNVTSTMVGKIQLATDGSSSYCLKATNNGQSVWYTPNGQFSTAIPTGAALPASGCPA